MKSVPLGDSEMLDWMESNNGAWCGSERPHERYLYHGTDWSARKIAEATSLRAAIARAKEYTERCDPKHVLKAEGASPDATDLGSRATASPDGGPMGAGQAAAAAPDGESNAMEQLQRQAKDAAAYRASLQPVPPGDPDVGGTKP